MIEMHVAAIALDKKSGEPMILMSDAENKRALPIWVGAAEARAISVAIQKILTPRPLTHDLLHAVIQRLGCSVKEVRITELKNNIFHASIVLAKRHGSKINPIFMDARPSDAIALAVIAKAPVMVADEIVLNSCIAALSETDLRDKEDFKNFLDEVKASDFNVDVLTKLIGLDVDEEDVKELLSDQDDSSSERQNDLK